MPNMVYFINIFNYLMFKLRLFACHFQAKLFIEIQPHINVFVLFNYLNCNYACNRYSFYLLHSTLALANYYYCFSIVCHGQKNLKQFSKRLLNYKSNLKVLYTTLIYSIRHEN